MTAPIRVAHIATVDLTPRFLLLPQLLRLRDDGFEVTTICAPGPWTRDLESLGIRHIPWPHATRAWNLRADLIAFWELVWILRRERFDLVHTHNPKPGILGRIAARLAGVPYVVNTVHGFYTTPDDPPLKRIPVLALERLAARFSDLELYQSEEDLDWARRTQVVAADRSDYLGNGVDLSVFNPSLFPAVRLRALRRELGIPEHALVVGTVARLVAEKGYRQLFSAARAVRAVLPDVQVLAIGAADPEKTDALSQAEIKQMAGIVTFAGWRQDVPSLLALIDVFVLASWREGLPRSAIEAAALGKPLILTNIRGCREVARDGIEGLLVPPRDAAQLAAAIELLARDRNLREQMGAAARARALERFDETKITELIVTRYRSLLARRGHSRTTRRHPHRLLVHP